MSVFDPKRVYTYFSSRYGIHKATKKGWYAFDCPFCGGIKKRAVNIGYGITKCWTCIYRGSVSDFVQAVENCSYYTAKEILNTIDPTDLNIEFFTDVVYENISSNVVLPDGYKSLMEGTGVIADRARNYLKKRGFDIERLDSRGYGYCDEHSDDYLTDFFGYIIIPYLRNGILRYYIGRAFLNQDFRYKNPTEECVKIGKSEVLYNESALLIYDEVAITEGALDAEFWDENGIASSGWCLSNYQFEKMYRSPAKTFVFIPDAGANKEGCSYYKMAVNTATRFLDTGKSIYVVDLNVPEFDHIITKKGERAKDVNEIGVKNVRWQLSKTKKLTWSLAMSILNENNKHKLWA